MKKQTLENIKEYLLFMSLIFSLLALLGAITGSPLSIIYFLISIMLQITSVKL